MTSPANSSDIIRRTQIRRACAGLYQHWENATTGQTFSDFCAKHEDLAKWTRHMTDQGFSLSGRLMPYEVSDMVADTFRALILQYLGPETCSQIDEDNKAYDDSVCASHDYCDANVFMDEALRLVGFKSLFSDDGGMPDPVVFTWNEAWNIAKEKGFAPTQ